MRVTVHEEILRLLPPEERAEVESQLTLFDAADAVFKPQRDVDLEESAGFIGCLAGGDNVFLDAVVNRGVDGELQTTSNKSPHVGRKRTGAEREWAESHREEEALRKKAERDRKREEKAMRETYEDALFCRGGGE